MKNFESQASETPKLSSSAGNLPPKKGYKKPVALSVPARVPPVPQFELQMVEKRFRLPIFAFREKTLSMIEQNRILLVQVGLAGSLKSIMC